MAYDHFPVSREILISPRFYNQWINDNKHYRLSQSCGH